MITLINRLCCTFAYKAYQVGPQKKVVMLLTCTGSDCDEMKRHVSNILTLPSVSRAIKEYKTEVFGQCMTNTTCQERVDYLNRVKELTHFILHSPFLFY